MYFEEGQEQQALDRAANRPTMLTEWFALNGRDPEARNMTYCEVGTNYVWRNYKWTKRKVSFISLILLFTLNLN